MEREQRDRQLFEEIGYKYAQKDIYPVSKIARTSQVNAMKHFIVHNFKIESFEKVIEVGCGHGANSEYFDDIYVKYLGVDYSKKLIHIAQKRYNKSKQQFKVGNIKNLDKYGKFDLVIGIGILHHVDDIKAALNSLQFLGHKKTVYLFYEPQSKNPLIQFLRFIRTKVDKSFSSEQVFFKRKELIQLINNTGFKNIHSRYHGYFIPPFAQVILKPKFIFMPLCKIAILLDDFLFKRISNHLAWNFIITFTK